MSITTIKFRRGPSSEWIDKNPVLEHGEPGFEYEDEGSPTTITKQKIGDGATPWVDLPYVAGDEPPVQEVSLSAATDVDISGVQDGYVLTYDIATGKWLATPGGAQVGSWENDQVVNFQTGTATNAEVSIPVSSNVYPANPQHTLTVTEAMLATADRDDVGFTTTLAVSFLFDGTGMTGGTSTTLSAEMGYLGELLAASVSINTTSQARPSVTFFLRDAKVGDVLTFKFRLNSATFGGVNCVAYAVNGYPQGILQAAPDNGGFYMYQSLQTGAALPLPGFPAAYPVTPVLMTYKLMDAGAVQTTSTNSHPEAVMNRWVGTPPHGVYNTYQAHEIATRLAASTRSSANTSAWSVSLVRAPSTIQFDRIAIPQPPI